VSAENIPGSREQLFWNNGESGHELVDETSLWLATGARKPSTHCMYLQSLSLANELHARTVIVIATNFITLSIIF